MDNPVRAEYLRSVRGKLRGLELLFAAQDIGQLADPTAIPREVARCIAEVRAVMSEYLAEHLREALAALERAEAELRHDTQPARDAIQHELVRAATSVGRALHLLGEGR